MVGKLLKIILPDKIENRKAEVYKQALDLSPGYSDFWEAGIGYARGRGGRVVERVLWGGSKDLMQRRMKRCI